MQMKMKMKVLASLFLSSSVAQASELDDLIASSAAIVDQINTGILMTGAAMGYAHTGTGLSDGQLAGTAYITTEQVNAYNQALSGMITYLPYGSAQDYLEEQAAAELALMEAAIDDFTTVVVNMLAVQGVAELAAEADTPDEEAAVQEYVTSNTDALTIDQSDADAYNQSLDSIETHANAAGAFLGVAANPDAVAFLDQGAMDNNTRVETNTLSYSASTQAVSLAWTSGNPATSIYVNGSDAFNINLYVSHQDILTAGASSELYLTGPTYLGYECFMTQLNCEETEG
jgi:hypothetical protein